MAKPVVVKLGGSVLTDKARERSLRRSVARRAVGEVAKAGLPTILLHGAGSYGHPAAARAGLGRQATASAAGRAAASEVLAAVGTLHAQVVEMATAAGLRPVSVPVHLAAHSEGDSLLGLPVDEVRRLLEEGHTPLLAGTLVRDAALGWRVASADEMAAALAGEASPRLVLFASDVDGLYDRDPAQPGARLLRRSGAAPAPGAGAAARGADVTGGMAGKLGWARQAARMAPTLLVNGLVRGRILQALQGREVLGTWVDPS